MSKARTQTVIEVTVRLPVPDGKTVGQTITAIESGIAQTVGSNQLSVKLAKKEVSYVQNPS